MERTAERDDGLSTEDDQPQRALHLVLVILSLGSILRPTCRFSRFCATFALDPAELVTLGEDEVHVLVEREELTDQGARVVQGDPDAVVDDGGHLAALHRGRGPASVPRSLGEFNRD